MTRASIQEYTEAVRGRYPQTKKREKSQILDEFTKVIGCHRKAAIRLLRRGNQPMSNKKRGRPRQYGATVARALRVVWQAADRLVSHCGDSSEGLYLTTLSTVDVASGWSECVGVWEKNRSGSVVRRLVGYSRYNSRAALEALNRIYDLTRLYVNFLQPVMRLVSKTRHGAKVHKVYDMARTPYQRWLRSGALTEAKRQELAATYHGLNPVLLLSEINENLEHLWKLAERPAYQQRRVKTYKAWVT